MRNWLFACIILLASCTNIDRGDSAQKEGLHIEYFANGKIKSVLNYKDGNLEGECLRFHENGKLRTKVIYKANIEEGVAYYFYPSGTIEADRVWLDGHKIGYAQDYYDTSGYIKAFMYYNDDGGLVWRKTVDQQGKLIKVEGQTE